MDAKILQIDKQLSGCNDCIYFVGFILLLRLFNRLRGQEIAIIKHVLYLKPGMN